jgi:flagellar biosynthesis/type III secretory pathway M-ring protein FliF/YscJ
VVESLPFTAPPPVTNRESGLPFGLGVDQLVTIAKLLIVGVIGLAAILLLRPRAASAIDGGDLLAAGRAGAGLDPAALPSTDQMLRLNQPGAALPAPGDRPVDEEIAEAQAEAGAKHSALNRVGDAVARNPAEAAALIRQWMNG